MALFRCCPGPCEYRHGHGPLDPAVWLSRLGFSHCSCQGCLLQTIPVCVKSCTNPLLQVVGKEQSLLAPVNNDVTAIWSPAGAVNKLMVWARCGRASSRELVWALCSGLEGLISETSPCGWRPCWDTREVCGDPQELVHDN